MSAKNIIKIVAMSKKKTVRTEVSRVSQVSTDDSAVYNDHGQNNTNEGGRLNNTEYPQVSNVPETEGTCRSGK